MLGETVSNMLEENKLAERKALRAEEKLSLSEIEKEMTECLQALYFATQLEQQCVKICPCIWRTLENK